jgi:hypothetical protein
LEDRLGIWVNTQRTSYKKKPLNPAHIAHIRALESVKGWVWDTYEADWQEGFDHLKRFVKRENHARVPKAHIEDGFKLGQWTNNLRARKGGLSPDRIRALESVKGWVWDSLEADWQEGFDHLKRFVKSEKHARVPAKHIEGGFKLGIWVSNQRAFYKNEKKPLAPARIEALESVKGWVWNAR